MQPESPLNALLGGRRTGTKRGGSSTPTRPAQHDHDQAQPKSLPAPRPVRRGGNR